LNPTHNTLGLLSRYVFALVKYDLDYDVRDRGRVLHILLTAIAPVLRTAVNGEEYLEEQGGVILRREQVKAVLFDGKMEPIDDESTIGALLLMHGYFN
jgi:AP-3 complex subunit beta